MNAGLLENILIRPLGEGEAMPYELLLDADPSMDAIAKYLERSDVYVALLNDKVIGVFVLYPSGEGIIEIKNIAVAESLQNKGIGKLLLAGATEIAAGRGAKAIEIGTSNASIAQLYLYQKEGFEMTGIKQDFFLNNYPEPLFENGIQCRHMLMLTKHLL